jgi:class 3 adenylate cyclase/tetratricopeptide (TPR) repeat protein
MVSADDSFSSTGTGSDDESLDQGRRCHVTLLFSDLCDYTSLSENADPEDVAGVLRATKALAARIIEKHGGTLNQFYGDGLLAVFGLPQASEHDTRRAAEAALELHEAVRTMSFEFELPPRFSSRLHTGIHSGLVFARTSDARDGRYEIVGDPINTAARLCAAAGPDEILASETTLQGVAPFFELEAIAALRLKGKFDPLPAFRLLRSTGLSTRFEARAARGLTPFVGRSAELARLLGAFESVLGGSCRLCHVRGDVGVGKTRLVDEFKRRLSPRVAVYCGACESYGHAPPLQPFLQILEQAFELVPGAPQELSRQRVAERCSALGPALMPHVRVLEQALGLAAPGKLDPDQIAQRNAAAVASVLSALATERPLCLILDDWHAVDDASYRVLSRLLDALSDEPRPVLVLSVGRGADASDPLTEMGERIELGPLDAADAASAIQALLPSALELGVAENIRERSGGNPLFLEELCRAYPFASRELEQPSSQKIPNALHGLIQARIERLPPELLRLARAAAVIGTEFEAWLLERAVVDAIEVVENDLGEPLQRLELNAVVYQTDRPGIYRYKHGVTRDVVYDSVRIGERRRLHARIAEAIEARWPGAELSAHCEALAHHYSGAGRPGRAAKYAEIAGDRAASSSSLDRARQHYRAALVELDKLSSSQSQRARWLEVSRKWAAACVFSPAPEQIEILERALRHTEEIGAAVGIAHSHYWLAWIHYALGDQERALQHTHQALAIAEHGAQGRLQGQLWANLGQIQLACAAPREALNALERALAIKSEQARSASGATVPVGFVYGLGCQGVVHAYQGDFGSAQRCLDQALSAVEGRRHAIEGSVLGLLAMLQLWRGQLSECVQVTERMRQIAERVGGPYVFAMSRSFGGYARWMLTRDDRALDELAGAVDWIEQREMHLFHSFGLALVAEAFFEDRRYEAAERYALRALERAEQLDRLGELAARRVLARCRARSNRLSEAEELLDDARTIAAARGSSRELALTELARAELLSEASDPEASASLQRARDELSSLGVRIHAPPTARY